MGEQGGNNLSQVSQQEDPPACSAGPGASMRTPTSTAIPTSHHLWRERNKEHLIRYEQERYQRRKEAKAAYIRQWRKEHPEAKRKENQVRKERMGGRLRNFGKPERELLFKKQLGLCGICGHPLNELEIDHIVPLCKGGPHVMLNVHVVHSACNRAKGQKLRPTPPTCSGFQWTSEPCLRMTGSSTC